MKIMKNALLHRALFLSFAAAITGSSVLAQQQYQIQAVNLPGQSTSSLQAISSSGNWAIGTSNSTAIAWSPTLGTVTLSNIPGRSFMLPQSINNFGIGAGFGATTAFGSSPLPGTWNANNGSSALVPLPSGETIGRVYGINDSSQMAGSSNGGSLERATSYTLAAGTVLPQTFANGGVLTTAYDINSNGRIVGQGLNPNNAAVTNAFYVDPGDNVATDIGALVALGHNSAIAFAVSQNGLIAGSSSLNSGANARPFIWQQGTGMLEIPLLAGTSQGSARGVNSFGQVVGNMSGATSVLFLYDGTQTWRLQDLLVNANGWDLVGGTSNAAFGIADNGTIVGRGLFNGQITGFVMTAVPEPSVLGLWMLIPLGLLRRNRR